MKEKEISIKELAEFLRSEVGYTGRVIWNEDYQDGQPKRSLEVSKARKYLQFEAEISRRDASRRHSALGEHLHTMEW